MFGIWESHEFVEFTEFFEAFVADDEDAADDDCVVAVFEFLWDEYDEELFLGFVNDVAGDADDGNDWGEKLFPDNAAAEAWRDPSADMPKSGKSFEFCKSDA